MTGWNTRADWNAHPAESGYASVDPRSGVVIHHIGDGRWKRADHADCLKVVHQIQHWHFDHPTENYIDFAYNLAACHHDFVIEGRSTKGAMKVRSAATGNANSHTVAVLALWGMGDGTPPSGLLDALGYATYRLRKDAGAGGRVTGHRDWMQTACPGLVYPKLGTVDSIADKLALPPMPKAGYTVVKGDTLSDIGKRFGVKWQDIAKANGLRDPYVIHPGDVLVIPGKKVHTVRRGDTLWSIGRQYRVTWQDIAKANRISPPYTIHVGQTLVIP